MRVIYLVSHFMMWWRPLGFDCEIPGLSVIRNFFIKYLDALIMLSAANNSAVLNLTICSALLHNIHWSDCLDLWPFSIILYVCPNNMSLDNIDLWVDEKVLMHKLSYLHRCVTLKTHKNIIIYEKKKKLFYN